MSQQLLGPNWAFDQPLSEDHFDFAEFTFGDLDQFSLFKAERPFGFERDENMSAIEIADICSQKEEMPKIVIIL